MRQQVSLRLSRKWDFVVIGVLMILLYGCATLPLVQRDELIGSWRLVSRIDRTPDGRTLIEPTLGSNPVALLIYDRGGNVSAQLMRRDRNSASPAGAPIDPNNSGALNGYDAYLGVYTVDQSSGTVTHTLTAALVQSDIGRKLVRRFRFDRGDLIIWFEVRGPSGEQVTRTLTWRRADR